MTRRASAAAAVAVVVAGLLAGGGYALGRDGAAQPATETAQQPSAVDVGFSQDMATHHEQAVLMAGLASSRGGPTVRAIASGILAAQSQEIGAMRGWLRLWDEPAADPHPMAWMAPAGTHGMEMGSMDMDATAMPGMAGSDELARLSELRGKRFDVLFLQLMIRHHQGGIIMAADAKQHASLAVVRAAAGTMIVEQTEDIGTMRALLRADGGRQLPTPR